MQEKKIIHSVHRRRFLPDTHLRGLWDLILMLCGLWLPSLAVEAPPCHCPATFFLVDFGCNPSAPFVFVSLCSSPLPICAHICVKDGGGMGGVREHWPYLLSAIPGSAPLQSSCLVLVAVTPWRRVPLIIPLICHHKVRHPHPAGLHVSSGTRACFRFLPGVWSAADVP